MPRDPLPQPPLSRDDLRAAIQARAELDPELEPEVIDAFLDRIEQAVQARVDARVRDDLASAGIVPLPQPGRTLTFMAATLRVGTVLTAVSAGAGALVAGSEGGIIGIAGGLTAVALTNLFALISEIHQTEVAKELTKERLRRMDRPSSLEPHWVDRLVDAVVRLRART